VIIVSEWVVLCFGIGFALHRPRIVVEIWRGSTRLRAASC
jgi:hypothetical protein